MHRAIANRIMREQRDREERLRLEIERAEKNNKQQTTNNKQKKEVTKR